MKRIALIIVTALGLNLGASAQGYDIRITLKGYTDSMAYLAKYLYDQTYIQDTCKKVKNGVVQFKGKTPLDKGVYIMVNQDKAYYFDFLVNESQKITITGDIKDLGGTLNAPGNTENQNLFSYVKFNSSKNKEYEDTKLSTIGKSKEDSTKIIAEKVKQLDADMKKFDAEFMARVKGTFVYDLMNLRTEKMATDIPKASNGRPDSLYQYYYYKNHFFDGVDFKDERLARTQHFDDRIKRYFESVLVNNPDTIIKEIDMILGRCTQDNLNYNLIIGYLTYKYEQTKVIGFDKVFVHMIRTYIENGKATKVYSKETVKALKERADVLEPLLEGKKVPDLFVIDTLNAPAVRKMGFDTVKTSGGATALYLKNQEALSRMFMNLYNVQAKYTIVIFWAADCGHCQKDVPKIHESLKELKGKIDVKVFSVQTKDELYNDWKKFLVNNKLTDFINVYDPVHINNVKEKFDVVATPTIYLLDKDKKIIAKKLVSDQLVDLIKALDKERKS